MLRGKGIGAGVPSGNDLSVIARPAIDISGVEASPVATIRLFQADEGTGTRVSANEGWGTPEIAQLQRTVVDTARRYRDLQRRYLDAQLDRVNDVTLYELSEINRDLYEKVATVENALFAAVTEWEDMMAKSH